MASRRPAAGVVRSRLTWTGIIGAAIGLGLFVYAIRETGLTPILAGFRRLGWGFLAILALSGFRFYVRGVAWKLCTDAPERLRARESFSALLAGDTLGNLTPLGLLVSEPTKAALVRHRIPLVSAVSGIALENLLYTLSAAIVIAAGATILLATFEIPFVLRAISLSAIGITTSLTAVAVWMLFRDVHPFTTAIGWLDRRGWRPRALVSRAAALAALEDRVHGFSRRHPARLARVAALETAYHAAGVAEIYVTVILITPAGTVTWLTAFLLESLNRFINAAFKFVPLRLGVDEAGTGLLSQVLGLGTVTGVTLAVVRKARVLTWVAVGVALLTRRGLFGGAPAGDRGPAPAITLPREDA